MTDNGTKLPTTFTPTFDEFINFVDAPSGSRLSNSTLAHVFGAVFRYADSGAGECFASRETIAKRCGLSMRTTARALKLLGKRRLIIDLTPNLRNKAHRRVINLEILDVIIHGWRLMLQEVQEFRGEVCPKGIAGVP